MNIMCPISNAEEMEQVHNWGVQEIYFGLQNTEFLINNRRPSHKCNLAVDKETLAKFAHKMRQAGITIYVTVNSVVNNERNVNLLLGVIRDCMECGIVNFIVADINLLLAIRKNIVGEYHLTLSTCMPVYNQKTIDFFRKMNVERFVLPRHLLVNEIDELVQRNRECEFEVLIKNSRCINEDGNCAFEHGLANYIDGMEGGCCQYHYDVEYVGNEPEDQIDREILRKRYEYVRVNSLFACGACYIKHFQEIGVASLKIVGREFATSRKIKDIVFLTNCIRHAGSSEEEYKKFVKGFHKEVYGKECTLSQCYY